MELTLEHAKILARWFSLDKYKGLSLEALEALEALVWLHFPEYRNKDISRDLQVVVETIKR